MNFIINREELLKPLQLVCGVVERRQTLPILSHVLLKLSTDQLSLTATDLEVEMVAHIPQSSTESGELTLPARKFLDICRALPENTDISVAIADDKATIKAGRSRFTLATLPAGDFPGTDDIQDAVEFSLGQLDLKYLIDQTSFAMAHQDVRYYLNGLMLELSDARLRGVATDGHRLAMCDVDAELSMPEVKQSIVPRKGILEMAKLLDDSASPAKVSLSNNHIKVELPVFTFTSKLIDGKFPDYNRVLPEKGDKNLIANNNGLRQALTRASILSNEKYRGVRLQMENNLLRVLANNPEQEEAEEELEVNYQGTALEIGFNVTYLLDAISAITTEDVSILMSDPNSSCLIQAADNDDCRYVVMPMRL
ncbi:MAG: DNA polymerase III subunit beta [Gammaproteobacteria bacterium]|nr:MAG: DNA polymerase III subunit beta [Gammaproteobacteria bacterium]